MIYSGFSFNLSPVFRYCAAPILLVVTLLPLPQMENRERQALVPLFNALFVLVDIIIACSHFFSLLWLLF